MKELIILLVTAVICLTALGIVAMLMGINGTMFTIIVASITGTTGVGLDHFLKKRKMLLDHGRCEHFDERNK